MDSQRKDVPLQAGPSVPWLIVLLLCGLTAAAQSSVSVLTQHNDNARTGANLRETVLNVANVQRNFGRLYALEVDDDINTQPLFVPNVDVPNVGRRNLVYVATMNNTVYAFDADSEKPCRSGYKDCWSTSLGPAVPVDDLASDLNCNNLKLNLRKHIGIIGTPVVSLDRRLLYVVSFTKEKGEYGHYLHALYLTSGARTGTSVRIASDGFKSKLQMQRAALLLSRDIVYAAFGSYGDCHDPMTEAPFHGWVFGFNTKSLNDLPKVFNTTPSSQEGGIWQGGQGLAADEDGNIYAMSGNGDFDQSAGHSALGTSFIKLNPDLSFRDRFTPWNADDLNKDLDLGSGGALLLPGTNLLVGGGKEGVLYLLDRKNLGGYRSKCGIDLNQDNCGQIVQWFQATTAKCASFDENKWPQDPCPDPAPAINSQGGYYHIHGSPVY